MDSTADVQAAFEKDIQLSPITGLARDYRNIPLPVVTQAAFLASSYLDYAADPSPEVAQEIEETKADLVRALTSCISYTNHIRNEARRHELKHPGSLPDVEKAIAKSKNPEAPAMLDAIAKRLHDLGQNGAVVLGLINTLAARALSLLDGARDKWDALEQMQLSILPQYGFESLHLKINLFTGIADDFTKQLEDIAEIVLQLHPALTVPKAAAKEVYSALNKKLLSLKTYSIYLSDMAAVYTKETGGTLDVASILLQNRDKNAPSKLDALVAYMRSLTMTSDNDLAVLIDLLASALGITREKPEHAQVVRRVLEGVLKKPVLHSAQD